MPEEVEISIDETIQCFWHEPRDLLELCGLAVDIPDLRLRDLRCMPLRAGVEQHETTLQFHRRHDHRMDLISPTAMNFDQIEASVSALDLILNTDRFLEHVLL